MMKHSSADTEAHRQLSAHFQLFLAYRLERPRHSTDPPPHLRYQNIPEWNTASGMMKWRPIVDWSLGVVKSIKASVIRLFSSSIHIQHLAHNTPNRIFHKISSELKIMEATFDLVTISKPGGLYPEIRHLEDRPRFLICLWRMCREPASSQKYIRKTPGVF